MVPLITQHRVSRRTRSAVNQASLTVSLVVGAAIMAVAVELSACSWLGWFALVPLFLVIRRWRPTVAALGGARLTLARRCLGVLWLDRGAVLSPQTFLSSALFCMHAPRARAPPILPLVLRAAAMG